MRRHALYEVWFSRGKGLEQGPKFRNRQDAEHYVTEHEGQARYALRTPEGRWETFAARRAQHAHGG